MPTDLNSPDLSELLDLDCKGNGPICRAARTMGQLSHPHRLRVLCLLVEEGELSVAGLLEKIPLSPSALSQHLAKMKEEGLLRSRRAGKSVYYAIDRSDILQILELLHRLYCEAEA